MKSLLVLLALVCLTAAACGGNDDPGDATTASTAAASGGTTAPAAACADAAALKTSVDNLDQLGDVDKASLGAALTDIRTKLTALKQSGGSQWGAQIDKLDTEVGAFQTTVATFDTDNPLDNAPAVVRNLERIGDAWEGLERDIDAACPAP
jgi:hypothetical protein